MIASALLESANTLKVENDKIRADAREKEKWELWCGHYGTPTGTYQMLPLPANPEWGMWGLVWVPKEEWWNHSNQYEK